MPLLRVKIDREPFEQVLCLMCSNVIEKPRGGQEFDSGRCRAAWHTYAHAALVEAGLAPTKPQKGPGAPRNDATGAPKGT